MTSTPTTVTTDGTVVEKAGPRLMDDADLGAIQSFADAMALLQSAGMTVADITEEYGTGFDVLDDKRQLVKVPFLILSWRFSEGDHGKFVSMMIVTREAGGVSRKLIVNDGSTGIRKQMEEISEDRLQKFKGDVNKAHAGLLVPKGLRISEYDYVNDKGVKTPASTFYLNI